MASRVIILVTLATVLLQANGKVVRQASGCYYKGKTYYQGQTWQDGCTYVCTCADAAVGKYNCNPVCLSWDLPPACHLNKPAFGMCCGTPSCPAGWQINYPPGYQPR